VNVKILACQIIGPAAAGSDGPVPTGLSCVFCVRWRWMAGRWWSVSRGASQTSTVRCVWRLFARTAIRRTLWSTDRATTAGSSRTSTNVQPTIRSSTCC